jgi:hypothetical protein
VESLAKRSSGVDATALGVDAVIEGVVSDDMSVDASHNDDAPRASFLVVFVEGFDGS